MAAFTMTTINNAGPIRAEIGATRWTLSGTSADASGCEELKATPGAGYRLCIERIYIYIGAAITVTFGSGETGPGSVEGDKITVGGAAGTYWLDVRDRPIALTANKSFTADASGPGTVTIYAEGFTKIA